LHHFAYTHTSIIVYIFYVNSHIYPRTISNVLCVHGISSTFSTSSSYSMVAHFSPLTTRTSLVNYAKRTNFQWWWHTTHTLMSMCLKEDYNATDSRRNYLNLFANSLIVFIMSRWFFFATANTDDTLLPSSTYVYFAHFAWLIWPLLR